MWEVSERMHEVEALLEECIYPHLDRAVALKDLNPVEIESRYLLTCPQCGKKTARIFKTGVILFCQCGYFRDIFAYTKERNNLSDLDTIRQLATLAQRVDLLEDFNSQN